MSKSTAAVTLFRILIAGTVIAGGGYLVAQSILNKDSDNINIGPFTLTFRVDTEGDQTTKQVCVDNSSSTIFSCNDQYVTAYYKDNYQTLADKIPVAGEVNSFPKLEGYHIQWDIDNLNLVTSNLIIKGRYIENSVTHKVVFKTDYDTFIGTVLVEDTKGPNEKEMADINELAKSIYEKTGSIFAHWDVRYADRFDENGDPLMASLHYVNADIIATAIYTPRFVEVNFLDVDGSTVLANKEVRFGSTLGEIPASIYQKVEEYQARKDAYYYLGKVTSDGGIIEIDPSVDISSNTLITTPTNDESYNIQILSRSYVTVTFISSYDGQTKTDVRSFSYTEGHKLNAADFSSIDAIEHNGIDISWPVDEYLGVVVDHDIVIQATYSIKKVNISYEAYVADFNTGVYSKVDGILPSETDSVDYGSTLSRSLNVSSFNEYQFVRFELGTGVEIMKEADLSLLTFSEDTVIKAYFTHRAATVTFKNAVNASQQPAIINTYIGAPSVAYSNNNFNVVIPEGKYFTNTWTYSYKHTVNGVTSTVNKIYNSTPMSGETITITEGSVVLTPVFEDITFTVLFKYQDGSIAKTYSKVIYGTEDLARAVPEPSLGNNERFLGWFFDRNQSIGVGLATNPLVGKICAEKDSTVVFVARIETQEVYVNFYEDSSGGVPVYSTVNPGSRTFIDFIRDYTNLPAYQDPVRPGYKFIEWVVPTGYSLDDIAPSSINLSIVARFEGIEMDVQYNLVYLNSEGAKIETPLTSVVSDRVKIGEEFIPDLSALEELVFQSFNYGDGYTSSNFELNTTFNTTSDFNGSSFKSGDLVTYDPSYVDNNGNFRLFVQVVPKSVGVTYYAALDGEIVTLGSNYSYTVTSNKDGYKLLWKNHFNFQSHFPSFDVLYDFGGWVVDGVSYTSNTDFISDSKITGDLKCYAIIHEKKVKVNIYALKNVTPEFLNNNSTEHTYLPYFNDNYQKLYSSSLVDRGGSVDLTNNEFEIKTQILAFINEMRRNNGQEGDLLTLENAGFTISGVTYKLEGYRLLGGFDPNVNCSELNTLWGPHNDLNASLNLILSFSSII